jgi:hypothetical protein
MGANAKLARAAPASVPGLPALAPVQPSLIFQLRPALVFRFHEGSLLTISRVATLP